MKDQFSANLIDLVPIEGCTISDENNSCIRVIEDQIKTLTSDLGFDCFRYTIRQEAPNGQDSYSLFVSNFPSAWDATYIEKKYYNFDPISRIFSSEESKKLGLVFGSWELAKEYGMKKPIGKTESERSYYKSMVEQIYKEAPAFGLHSGIYFARGNNDKQSLISFASSSSPATLKKKLNDRFWKTIYLMSIAVEHAVNATSGCETCMQGLQMDGKKPVVLSTMQRRIMIAFHNNPKATIGNIADINKLTINTINFHLKQIRKKTKKLGYSGHALAQFSKNHNMF